MLDSAWLFVAAGAMSACSERLLSSVSMAVEAADNSMTATFKIGDDTITASSFNKSSLQKVVADGAFFFSLNSQIVF